MNQFSPRHKRRLHHKEVLVRSSHVVCLNNFDIFPASYQSYIHAALTSYLLSYSQPSDNSHVAPSILIVVEKGKTRCLKVIIVLPRSQESIAEHFFVYSHFIVIQM